MKWNLESDKELKKLISEHHNYGEISIIMGRSVKSVQNRAFRLGLRINLTLETNCLNCGNEINRCRSHINKNNFCSKSCSTTYNNKKRVHSNETKEKIKKKLKNKSKKIRTPKIKENKPKKIFSQFNFNKLKKCGNCYNLIPIKNKICDKCKLEYYNYYRPLCEFKFNLNDYPNEFDFKLLKEYGMYSPINKNNNLTGVSRDHMYSVRDGFTNKINPEIIKHPANCKLMLHTNNNKKKYYSSITIGELLERIEIWNKKYIK